MSSAIKPRLAILASGGGSNADKICSYFHEHPAVSVGVIITSNPHAGVAHIAEKHRVDFFTVTKKEWADDSIVMPILDKHHITHIILAGFLLLIPEWLIKAYPDRIINIHPALLPKYGGKGMFGHHVHEAVKRSGDPVSGITIHVVDQHYDTGDIIFQHEVPLQPDDTAEMIASRVLKAEHYYYPRVIEKWVMNESLRP
jgi:phosphoribosylglycinamide formyltransferase 1